MTFKFDLGAAGLVPSVELDGSVALRDAAGAVVGRFAKPMLLDSSDVDGDAAGVRRRRGRTRPADHGRRLAPALADHRAGGAGRGHLSRRSSTWAWSTSRTRRTLLRTRSSRALTRTATSARSSGPNPGTPSCGTAAGPAAVTTTRRTCASRDWRPCCAVPTLSRPRSRCSRTGRTRRATASATWLGRVTGAWDTRSVTWNTRPAAVLDAATYETTQGDVERHRRRRVRARRGQWRGRRFRPRPSCGRRGTWPLEAFRGRECP